MALLRIDPDGAAADQRALSVATLALIRELAAEAPVLLALDDVQWVDESSGGVLPSHSAGCKAFRSACCSRCGRAWRLFRSTPSRLFRKPRSSAALVGPLSLAVLHRLFEARLGRSFPRLVLLKIEKASGGNPFYALEIGHALMRRGTDVTAGEPLPVPDGLATLTGERLRSAARRISACAAARGDGFRSDARDPCRCGVAEPALVLEPAVCERIVSFERGLIRFEHPLLAQAALASVDADALRELHLQLAEASRSEDARAHHLGEAASGPNEEAAAALEQSGHRARLRGASLDAVSLYDRASLLTPDPDLGIARASIAAEGAFIDLADAGYADAILARALERGVPGAARAEAMSLRALVWYFQGRQVEATRLCEEALAESEPDRVVRAKILLRCAYLHGQLDMKRSVRELGEALEILERGEEAVDDDLMAEALLDRANGALQMAQALRSPDIERAAHLHREGGRSWEWDRCEMILYELARHTDELETALARLYAQIERRANRGVEDPFRFVHAALINCWLGDWTTARTWAERAMETYEREGVDHYGAFVLRGLALVEALGGNVAEARRLSLRGLELADGEGDLVVANLHRGILGFVALSTGDIEEAYRELRAAAKLDERLGAEHPLRTRIGGDLVEAAVGVGDLARAERVVERLERAGRSAPTPWTLALGARCRGLLEAARGDLDAAAAALEHAVEEHRHLPMPFERGRTLLAKGRVHHRRKEKKLADSTLRAAARIFEELGSPLWAELARAELARVGLPRREPDELNETERRIAELAADGLSNKEIAQRAFLSVKTVEANLTRVYRKLGIRSRAALARRLS